MDGTPLDLTSLVLEDFAPKLGCGLRRLGETPVDLVLTDAKHVGQGHAGRAAPFSLIFAGPLQPALAQGIHDLQFEGMGSVELFLVPVGRSATGLLYEAVFN